MKTSNHFRPLLVLLVAAVASISVLMGAEAASQARAGTSRYVIAQAFAKWSAGGTTFFRDVLAPAIKGVIAFLDLVLDDAVIARVPVASGRQREISAANPVGM